MALSKKLLFVTFHLNVTQHNNTLPCWYAKCAVLFIVILSVVMLNMVMLGVLALFSKYMMTI